jgi:hypothetical protein
MAYWPVARAVANHDRLAAESVCQAGYEVLTPKIRVRVARIERSALLIGCLRAGG